MILTNTFPWFKKNQYYLKTEQNTSQPPPPKEGNKKFFRGASSWFVSKGRWKSHCGKRVVASPITIYNGYIDQLIKFKLVHKKVIYPSIPLQAYLWKKKGKWAKKGSFKLAKNQEASSLWTCGNRYTRVSWTFSLNPYEKSICLKFDNYGANY